MANLLAISLGLPDTSLNRFVEDLEELSGHPGEDSRLLSDLIAANSYKIAQLGLDPKDTTAAELYQALRISYEQAAQAFDRAIGRQPSDSLADRYQRVGTILSKQIGPPVWIIKRAELKKLLTKFPPRRLMKKLHYRTVESILKREDARHVLLIGRRVESIRWNRQISKAVAGLPPSCFEKQPATALVLPVELWRGFETKRPLVVSQPEVGLVAVWPNALAKDMTTLGVVALALKALDELTGWTVALDFHSLEPDFGKLASNLWNQPWPVAFELTNRPVAWYALGGRRDDSFSLVSNEGIPLLKSPDQQPPARPTGSRLSRLHVLLNWWSGSEQLIYTDSAGHPVSLNLHDVAINEALKTPFPKRTLAAARQSLFNELVARYQPYPGVRNMMQDRLAGKSEDSAISVGRQQRRLLQRAGNG